VCSSVSARPLFTCPYQLLNGRVSASSGRRQTFRYSQDGHTSQVLVGLLLESISFKKRQNTRFENPTAVSLNIPVFGCVTPCLCGNILLGLLDPCRRHDSAVFRDVASCLPNDTLPLPRMLESSKFNPVPNWGS
jgi:hypothetical protein